MSIRQAQIYSIVYKEVADFIEKVKPSGSDIVNIMFIRSNKDISYITLGLQIYPRNNIKLVSLIKNLRKKKSGLQLQISRTHNLKKIPLLDFVIDEQADSQEKINNLLAETN